MVTLRIDKWLRENWLFLIFALITASVAWFLRDAIYTSSLMLQSLTQAEATVLSLFGIIVAYLLTSYDSRLDRLEQEIFESERFFEEHKVQLERIIVDRSGPLKRRAKEISEGKRRTVNFCLLVGSVLVISLLLSVIAFGLTDVSDWEGLKAQVSTLDITFFFVGILGIFILFNRIAKGAEEAKDLVGVETSQPIQRNGVAEPKRDRS